MLSHFRQGFYKKYKSGFTIVELMVSIAIISILIAIALPNFSDFMIRTRVDNEISELHRLLLTARNTAINSEQNVTICPLGTGSTCDGNWQNELSVFVDADSDGVLDNGEALVKTKDAIDSGDKLQFSVNGLTYMPNGRLLVAAANRFNYCPKDNQDLSRGIEVSSSGRFNTTSDTDNDGRDETRAGTEITCS